MRVQRLVTEIGPARLALTRTEAAKVLADAGHELDHDTLDLLLQRTEGWPAALALAALYLGDGGSRPNLARFDGSDRLVADYVRDEVLGDWPEEVRSFAVRTCVADTLTSSLCDALVDRGGSAFVLEALAREGLVIPIDRTGSGTAITGWSATRCGPSSGASRSWSPTFTAGRAPGTDRPRTSIGPCSIRSRRETCASQRTSSGRMSRRGSPRARPSRWSGG